MQEMENNKHRTYDLLVDYNKIERIVFIGYAIATLKLIVSILSISYFTGMFWFIVIDITDYLRK